MYGIPRQLVSDNGPQFTSTDFIKGNGMKHIRLAPYHSSTNGQAECFIRTFKRSVKAGQECGLSVKHRVWKFLLRYRCTQRSSEDTNRTESTPTCRYPQRVRKRPLRFQ